MKRVFFTVPVVLLLFLAAGYAEETEYTDKKYGFSITYPSSYRVIKNYRGVPIIIFLPRSSFFFNDNIAISVTSARPVDRSLEELVDIYFKYDKTVSEKKEVLINDIKFLSVVQAQTKQFWFFKFNLKLHHLITIRGTRIYTITYTAAAHNYDKYIEETEKIMKSFRFTEK